MQRYIKFFIVGVSGVVVQLGVTWFCTHFIFGLEHYFWGYCFGLAAAIIYNFFMHTYVTFETSGNHTQRFAIFIVYNLFMALLQASTVKYLTPRIGLKYYLVVIASVIFVFSNITFILFKYILFKEKKPA